MAHRDRVVFPPPPHRFQSPLYSDSSSVLWRAQGHMVYLLGRTTRVVKFPLRSLQKQLQLQRQALCLSDTDFAHMLA